jgi:hypothetical protein
MSSSSDNRSSDHGVFFAPIDRDGGRAFVVSGEINEGAKAVVGMRDFVLSEGILPLLLSIGRNRNR